MIIQINLDKNYPILFFPLRIETKYYGSVGTVKKLRIRIFPDQISIDNFEPRLSKEEFKDATNYYVATDKEKAWLNLLEEYDCYRAAYIIKVLKSDGTCLSEAEFLEIHQDFRDKDEHRPASFNTLPNKFIIYGEYNNSLPPLIEEILLQQSPTILQVSPLSIIHKGFTATPEQVTKKQNPPEDPYTEISPDLAWLSDFDEAKKIGMATEIILTEQQYKSGFKYLIVFGVRDDFEKSPWLESKKSLEKLFLSHQYKGNLSFLKQNTPTNLIEGITPEYSSSEPDPLSYYDVVVGDAEDEDDETDGNLFEKFLGFDFIVKSVPNANITEQKDSKMIATLLFPAVLGNFIQMVRSTSKSFKELLDLEKIKNHFVNYVAPPGIIFRVNKTPYGLLPISILSKWDTEEISNAKDLIRLFSSLKQKWLDYSRKIPTIMNPIEGKPLEENLIHILSMDPHSHSYNARGIRNLAYTYTLKKLLSGFKQDYSDYAKQHTDKVDYFWDKFLPEGKGPLGLRKWAHDLILGRGISPLGYPLVGEDTSYIADISENLGDFFVPIEEKHLVDSDSPLFQKFLKFSAYFYALYGKPENETEFQEALNHIKDMDPKNIEMWMLKIMDTTSYRLDAWLVSLYNQKIHSLRKKAAYGLQMGAYGWVENLKPKINYPSKEGGYMRAYDHAQASALAVIRDAYLAHWVGEEKKDMLKINISSERTRNALETLQTLENIPLGEYLGMKLERRLHESELDYLIDEFRDSFPLQKDDIEELSDLTNGPKERIVPRNMTDGYNVHEAWKYLVEHFNEQGIEMKLKKIKNFMKGNKPWKKFIEAIKSYPKSLENIIPHLNYLLDIVDGSSDLTLYESIYHAVNLNFERAAAFKDSLSASGRFPPLESPQISLSGPRIIRRIVQFIEPKLILAQGASLPEKEGDSIIFNPRKISDASLNALLDDYVGNVKFWLFRKINKDHFKVANANPISLADLDLDPIDLLYIQETELASLLLYYGSRVPCLNGVSINKFKKPEDISLSERSFSEIRFMVNSIREIITSGSPLANFHFENPHLADELYAFDEVFEVLIRYYLILHKLYKFNNELTQAKNTSRDPNGVNTREKALMKASKFGISPGIRLIPGDNIENYIDELNNRIDIILDLCKQIHFSAFDNIDKELDFLYRILTDSVTPEREKIENVSSTYLTIKEYNFIKNDIDEALKLNEFLKKVLEIFIGRIRIILNNKTILILPHFTPTENSNGIINNLDTDEDIDEKAHKWLQKCSYTRPKAKLIDKVISYNDLFDSSKFSFFYNDGEFFRNTEEITQDLNDNPLSILAIKSNKNSLPTSPLNGNGKIVGIVIDEHTIKYPSRDQNTFISFHHNSPNAEAPQCLLLGVLPNDKESWSQDTIKDIILEALDLAKIRSVDYTSLQDLMNFLPLLVFNSYGEKLSTRLFQRSIPDVSNLEIR